MDEIHANLQNSKNHICPCAVVHEGHIDEFSKRKVLKNVDILPLVIYLTKNSGM